MRGSPHYTCTHALRRFLGRQLHKARGRTQKRSSHLSGMMPAAHSGPAGASDMSAGNAQARPPLRCCRAVDDAAAPSGAASNRSAAPPFARTASCAECATAWNAWRGIPAPRETLPCLRIIGPRERDETKCRRVGLPSPVSAGGDSSPWFGRCRRQCRPPDVHRMAFARGDQAVSSAHSLPAKPAGHA